MEPSGGSEVEDPDAIEEDEREEAGSDGQSRARSKAPDEETIEQ